MGKKSKTKGASYELKIAKLMSLWWRGDFHRVPASGGLNWGADSRVAGDIVPPQGLDFPFVIECKKREEWTMDHILLDISQPKEWWAQVVNDARRVKKVPMLIFSRNRAKDFVMIPYVEPFYDLLDVNHHDVMRTTVTIKNIREEVQKFDVIVTTMDNIKRIPPQQMREYSELVKDWDPYADEYK